MASWTWCAYGKTNRIPASDWVPSAGMHLSTGFPKVRSDGDYDVAHSYHCGTRCAAWMTSVIRRGGDRWTAVSSSLEGISVDETVECPLLAGNGHENRKQPPRWQVSRTVPTYCSAWD